MTETRMVRKTRMTRTRMAGMARMTRTGMAKYAKMARMTITSKMTSIARMRRKQGLQE